MSDQDIFDTNNKNPEATPLTEVEPKQGDLFNDQLKQIVDVEGRPKYDNVDKALEALKHSQEYIPTLKDENEKLKAELEKRESVEAVVKRLTTPEATEETTSNSLDEQAVQDLVNKALTERDSQTVQADNMTMVINTLTQKFGDKAKETIATKAVELGTTTKNLQEMARSQPKVFLALFGSAPVSTSTNPTTSSTVSTISPKAPHEAVMPKKSLLAGATSEEQRAAWRDIGKEVKEKHGFES